MKEFILHWRSGPDQNVSGYDIADAMRRAGIGNGALPALDYWEEAAAIERDTDREMIGDDADYDLGQIGNK